MQASSVTRKSKLLMSLNDGSDEASKLLTSVEGTNDGNNLDYTNIDHEIANQQEDEIREEEESATTPYGDAAPADPVAAPPPPTYDDAVNDRRPESMTKESYAQPVVSRPVGAVGSNDPAKYMNHNRKSSPAYKPSTAGAPNTGGSYGTYRPPTAPGAMGAGPTDVSSYTNYTPNDRKPRPGASSGYGSRSTTNHGYSEPKIYTQSQWNAREAQFRAQLDNERTRANRSAAKGAGAMACFCCCCCN